MSEKNPRYRLVVPIGTYPDPEDPEKEKTRFSERGVVFHNQKTNSLSIKIHPNTAIVGEAVAFLVEDK
ncbi:hypothetical protein [Marinicella sp. W31]|uniref:hypothetical protein n=1 Tax=Marinicella sp. W31 TaxID=3023713 RepID=UPI00375654A3